MRFDGTLESWNDARGFGFIAPAQGGQDIFVHARSFSGHAARPLPGMALTFAVELGPDGRKRAMAVRLAGPAARAVPRRKEFAPVWSLPRLLALPAFLVWYAYVLSRFPFKPMLALAYLVMGGIAFVAYALDKSAARQGRWRIAESTLHLLALGFGWPGALLAQQLLRHKTAKAAFVRVFWSTVVLNLAMLYVLHAPVALRLGL